MPNLSSAARCVCPFYLKETEKSISCEGIINGARTTLKFESTEAKRAHFERACCGFKYTKRCSLAASLDRKYKKRKGMR